LPFWSVSSSLKLPLFFLNVKELLIFFHAPPLLLDPTNPDELVGLPKSHCGGVVGGVIGSPTASGDDPE
jgi:hypothetical protein